MLSVTSPYLDMLSQECGSGENLVALEARHTALHVGVAQVFLEGTADLEARATDGTLPGHEVLVGVYVHQEIRFTGNNFSTSLTLVLSIHLVLLQELLNLTTNTNHYNFIKTHMESALNYKMLKVQ